MSPDQRGPNPQPVPDGAPDRLAPPGDAHAPLTDMLQAVLAGRYRIERELGRGGMATVFLARDLRHARTVAVKVLAHDILGRTGGERFLNEIRIAARLTHPHILGVHDSGEVEGLLYYVMPYVEGETLRARLSREGALPLPDATRLVRELADALAYAHAHGVVHRDLKPENVLLSGGHAVVADFGIAKALGVATQDGAAAASLTATGVSLGTPAYMAPEQAAGDSSIDHRADLYALGVVAYEALAGTHPFSARTPLALVAAHLTETPAPLTAHRADIPPTLAEVVMRLLAKDPAARPQSAEAVVQAIDQMPPAPVRRSSRSPVIALAVGTALVVAASVGVYAWRRASTSAAPPGARAITTLAVLPFENTSGNTADDYFSDGMTDELAHALARLPGLRLAGRTSSYAFKGRSVVAQEVGKALDVEAIVGGTVRRAGDRLRVTTQLVSARDGKVLWDSVFESRSGDVFAVQDEFTRAIAAALAPELGGRSAHAPAVEVARGTQDEEAYELYLQGQFLLQARGEENVRRSITFFHRAIARDSNFARAHAALAMAFSIFGTWMPDPKDSMPAIVAASARRAVALDSTAGEAQLALGESLWQAARFAEADAHLRAAITMEPSNVLAHHALGLELLYAGHTDEAISELRQATKLDPLAKSAGTALAYALAYARRSPEAIAESRRILALDSTYAIAFPCMALAQALAGQIDSAVGTIELGVKLHPDLPMQRKFQLFIYATAGRWDDVQRIRTRLHRPGGDPTGGIDAAFADMLAGDREPLIRLLSTEAGRRRWTITSGFGCNPLLDELWSDARFVAAMRAAGGQPCPLARPWPFHAPSRIRRTL